MTTETKTPKALKPCTCSLFEVGQFGPDGSAESYEGSGTDCERQTVRLFAQGHDAKLVGFLVRGELAGLEISRTDGGMRTTFPGAIAAAKSISEALGTKAESMLATAKRKADEKAAREATKQAAKTTKASAEPTKENEPQVPAETKPATRRQRATKSA